MRTPILSATVLILAVSTASCNTGFNQDSGIGRSKVTSVSMKIPSEDSQQKAFVVEGYTIQIKKTGGDCLFTDILKTDKIVTGEAKIQESLTQNCDYSLQLSFGKLAADGNSVEGVYLTNGAHDGKVPNLAIVKKSDISGQSKVSVKACVSVTTAGIAALSISGGECLSVADTSVDVEIDVKVGDTPPTTVAHDLVVIDCMKSPFVTLEASIQCLEDYQASLLNHADANSTEVWFKDRKAALAAIKTLPAPGEIDMRTEFCASLKARMDSLRVAQKAICSDQATCKADDKALMLKLVGNDKDIVSPRFLELAATGLGNCPSIDSKI
jgi:predicted small secreted protein